MRAAPPSTPVTDTRGVFVAMVLVITALLSGCTDATDAYCQELENNAGLDSLSAAIETGDLSAASTAADDFVAMAEHAPTEIRADMREIANGVVGIVELLEQERRETSVSDDVGSTTETEQLRDALNERFDDLDRRSARVETWVTRNCGLDLS